MEWFLDDYMVSTDKCLLSVPAVFDFLSRSFRSSSRSYEEVEKWIENSLCFGLYQDRRQIGFARIISDLSTVYLLADVFVLEEHRGKGSASGSWNV